MRSLVSIARRPSALALVVLFGFIGAGSFTTAAGADPYSTAPLDSPLFNAEQVGTETARLNNWLIENLPKLNAPARQGPREALFTLLSSHVAHLQKTQGSTLPTGPDVLLQTIFSWSEPLGVFGGHLVFNEMRSRNAENAVAEMPEIVPVPPAFSLSLEGAQFRLASEKGGWSVDLPYYFMIFGMDEITTKNGPRTQIVTISTASAKHEGRDGLSQSTLVLMAGPGQAGGSFQRYWERAQGFGADAQREPLGVEDLRSLRRFTAKTMIHSELVGWVGRNGPIVVTYSGVAGPFEKNRPHFLDFVRSLRANSQ